MLVHLLTDYSSVQQFGATGLCHIRISSKKSYSQSASSVARSKAINLDFIVDFTIRVYLEDFLKKIAVSPSTNTYPIVDFILLEFEIQFAFEYSSSTAEHLV